MQREPTAAPSARPCVLVEVLDSGDLQVTQYLHGRKSAGYVPAGMAAVLNRFLPQALAECLAEISPAPKDPA